MKKVIVVGNGGVTGLDVIRDLTVDNMSIAEKLDMLKDRIPVRKSRAIGPSTTMELTNPYDNLDLWGIESELNLDLPFPEDWNTGKKTGMKHCSMNSQKRAKLRKKRKKRKR